MKLTVGRPLIPSHSLVDTKAERDHYWTRLAAAWKLPAKRAQLPTYFPGCNPCSLARSRLGALREARHLIALKSDGVRYALFLTTRPRSTAHHPLPVALMIDRSRNMYEVEVVAPEAFFLRDTVLEGELVWRQPGERQLLYLVFDAVCIAGTHMLDKPFEERLAEATRCVRWSEELGEDAARETDSIALVHFEPSIVMRPKRFVEREHAARLWNERGDAEHRVDGIILQRADAPYVCGTADGAVYKWKDHSTVDLVGPPHSLRASDGPLGTHVGGRRVEVMESRVVGDDKMVVEYHVDVTADEVHLFALRTRPDKNVANGLRVVHATVQDVVDAITPEELSE